MQIKSIWYRILVPMTILVIGGELLAETAPLGPSGPRILKKGTSPEIIGFKMALERSLTNHLQIRLAQNLLEQRKAQRTTALGALLPKVRLGTNYTINVPENKASLPIGDGSQAALAREVAYLLSKNPEDRDRAEALSAQADLMERRNTGRQIVISPAHVVEGRISVEIPLFSGPDVARVMKGDAAIGLQSAKVSEERAKTIFAAANAYYLAHHLKNMVELREQELKSADERYLTMRERVVRGLGQERELLLVQADYFGKRAAHQASLVEYRSAIGHLGLIIGMEQEFAIEDPSELIFEILEHDADALVRIALVSRPDLKAAEEAVSVAVRERLSNFMQFLPTISFRGDTSITSNTKGFSGEPVTFAFSINASMSLFEGGSRISRLRESSFQIQEADLRLSFLKRDVEASVRGRKERIARLLLEEQASALKVDAGKELEATAIGRYERGLILQEEMLKAMEERFMAQVAQQKAKADLNTERLALIHEAGLLTPKYIQ